jgi:hypothetical protein
VKMRIISERRRRESEERGKKERKHTEQFCSTGAIGNWHLVQSQRREAVVSAVYTAYASAPFEAVKINKRKCEKDFILFLFYLALVKIDK